VGSEQNDYLSLYMSHAGTKILGTMVPSRFDGHRQVVTSWPQAGGYVRLIPILAEAR